MLIEDVIKQLTYGELYHVGVKDLTKEDNKQRIVAAINLGLTDLHKRFWLREGNLNIQITPEVSDYIITNENCLSYIGYATSNSRYVLDSISEPYQNDLLKIERIFSPEGEYQPLNDDQAEYSFFTPRYNLIRVPPEYLESMILVEYRAKHPEVSLECNSVIDISESLLQALLLFVGFRISASMTPDAAGESNSMLALYEQECLKITNYSYQVVPDRTNCKLDNRGWV